MAIPLHPDGPDRRLHREAAARGREALSAGADAGAAVPLQSGLRRLRQDRLSGRDPEPAPVGRAMHGGDRRMRRAGGVHRRRRAAAAQATCRRSSRASSQRKKFVILCTNALLLAKKIDQYKPQPLLHLVDPPRRRPGDARQVGVPGRRLRQAVEAIKLAKAGASASRSTAPCSTTPSRSGSPKFFDEMKALGRRRHHRLAGLRLRARARPGALPQPAARPSSCSATSSRAAQAARTGRSPSRPCSWTSWPATRPTTARPGATRRAPCSAGRSPATCSAKAMPRPSRS